jgi:uncharacterized protein
MSDVRIEVRGETLVLLPERAAFWPAGETLFIADAHWGKTAAFRASGLMVPGGTTTADLERLDGAIRRTGARRLVILGDLFHARAGRTPGVLAIVEAWRRRNDELDVLLVPGNHDRHAGRPDASLRFREVEPGTRHGPWTLAHHPGVTAADVDGYRLVGHLHPVALLRGAARERVRLPCFHLGAREGVLPAFGGFTGGALVRPEHGDRIYVIADGAVMRVPAAVAAGREQ